MPKLSKLFLSIIFILFQIGCSSSDAPEQILEDILNKNSVTLNNLEQHDITYENTTDNSMQIDRYCPSGVLKDTSNNVIGSWSIAANDLTLNTGKIYKTTNSILEKNVIYSTESAQTYKVIKIAQTVCL